MAQSLESCGMSECTPSTLFRFIPTLDIVLGCLFEAAGWGEAISFSATMTLEHLIQHVIPKIYPFRADPVIFLLRIFKTYFHCPVLTVEFKSQLVRGVLGGHMLRAGDAAQLRFFAPDLVEVRLTRMMNADRLTRCGHTKNKRDKTCVEGDTRFKHTVCLSPLSQVRRWPDQGADPGAAPDLTAGGFASAGAATAELSPEAAARPGSVEFFGETLHRCLPSCLVAVGLLVVGVVV